MISLKRVNAIFQKDFKDFSRNYAVSISYLRPHRFRCLFMDEWVLIQLKLISCL